MRCLATLLLVAAACDPQAGTGYLGEPLATLHGQVVSAGTLPPLEAAMLWQRGPPPSTDDQELATRAPVVSGFPATFTLHIYQPPPGAALRRLLPGEPIFARANAAAVPQGTTQDQLGPLPSTANPGYGIDPNHWLVYLTADVAAGSLTEWWLGSALPAGFHLLRVTPINPQCLAGDTLNKCVADLIARGVPDDGTTNAGSARYFCTAPYRLALASSDEQLLLQLGSIALGPGGGACP